MKRLFTCLSFLLLFLVVSPQHSFAFEQAATVQKGVLDVRSSNLTEKAISLNGEWEFSWGQFISADQTNPFPYSHLITVPSSWGSATVPPNSKLSNQGYGTYHLRILLPANTYGQSLALYIPPIASAYKLWINGELLAYNGGIGITREQMVPKSFAKVVSFHSKKEALDLVIQVSNFSQRKGGIWRSIQLGSEEVLKQKREYNVVKDVFLASSLFILGCYQLIVYSFHRNHVLCLFLGSFCLLITLRTLLVGDILLVSWFPTIPFEITLKLEYLTSYIGCMLLIMFTTYLYPKEGNLKLTIVFSAICILFSCTVVLPAIHFTKLLFLFQIFLVPALIYIVVTIVKATFQKRIGSLTNCFMIVLMIAAILNDIFYYHAFAMSTDLTPFGAFIGLAAQSVIIARRSSHAFTKIENLSAELQQMNHSLEERITARTTELQLLNQELQEANRSLQEMEQTRQELFASIAHELGTPMQSIQGYVQLIQQGLSPQEQEKYLQIVYEKTRLLNRLAVDLLELAKLEENQIQFHFEKVEVQETLFYFQQRLQTETEQNGLHWEYTPVLNIPDGFLPMAYIDFIRMEQVASNLLQNAIRYTPKEGTISLHSRLCQLQREDHTKSWHIEMTLSDTGSGIEPHLLPHIFKRFVKAKRPPSKGGTGLGLAICQQIIRHHGGTISVSSELGKGSAFTVTLPVTLFKEQGEKDE